MNLQQIETYLHGSDSQNRLRALRELQNYDAEVAVPLLASQRGDTDFLVRSLVAMGLAQKQTPESFTLLLELVKVDPDPNVRAEAANSLSYFGRVAVSHLVLAFYQDDHWLVRRSILAALAEIQSCEELFDVCTCGIAGEDATVRETSIDCLGLLAGSANQTEALELLLSLRETDDWQVRLRVARALNRFDNPAARDALNQLKQDSDHRVVGAALEGTV
jgi:HEAT repeat protein